MTSRAALVAVCLWFFACRASADTPRAAAPSAAPTTSADHGTTITLSVITTTDVHGRVESLPWLGGHLANLRERRARDGGGVLLVDSGDMFQGTLESNLGEGAAMVRGYNALGYHSAAIGNHEFDFGPAGALHLPEGPGDDPRGALKARAAQAKFPFLSAKVYERGATRSVAWDNVRPSALVTVAGVRVGIIGVTTKATPYATHPRNFAGLEVRPLRETIATAAQDLRKQGARIVIVTSHAGGDCERSGAPDDLGSCDPNEEIFVLARELPRGLVDMIAAGHTHQMVAHQVAGIPIVQAWSEGRGFGRVDFSIDARNQRLVGAQIHPPRPLCGGGRVPAFGPEACTPPPYEGKPVRFDEAVAKAVAADVATAQSRRQMPVGITLSGPLRREARVESPLGNFVVDLMRTAVPKADFAFINGGSLRSDLPAGPLLYGRLYEAFPFDDGIATFDLTAAQVTALIARNLERQAGILSLSGLTARARCEAGRLSVQLFGPDNRPWPSDRRLLTVTNGYLASGGDGLITGIIEPTMPDATPLRDRIAAMLAARGGVLETASPTIYSKRNLRLSYPGSRPVRCR
ncbi:MAG TPA: bifunctional UDP-sugar hydrolase/5'-nucleotidase [Polyangia bacterium]